jgi:hypothetical protein
METLLVKLFATALALSQVTTTPDAVTTEFDRQRDQPQVAEILHAGCTHSAMENGNARRLFKRFCLSLSEDSGE